MKTIPPFYAAVILVLLATGPVQAQAQESSSLLLQTLSALEEHHPAFAANEADLAAARAGYDSGRGGLETGVDLSVPSSGNDLPVVRAAGMEFTNLYSVTTSPALSIHRLLPTGGTLTASVHDSIGVSNYDASSSVYYESPEPEWTNTLTASFNVHQPLVFRGVYDATVSLLEQSFTTGLADYGAARNAHGPLVSVRPAAATNRPVSCWIDNAWAVNRRHDRRASMASATDRLPCFGLGNRVLTPSA